MIDGSEVQGTYCHEPLFMRKRKIKRRIDKCEKIVLRIFENSQDNQHKGDCRNEYARDKTSASDSRVARSDRKRQT